MKKLCSAILFLVMVMTILPLATASALPVLATPVPAVQTAPSMLSVMSIEPDESSTLGNGSIQYVYKYILYDTYQDFGRALNTLGYHLESSDLTNRADYNVTVSNAALSFSILYNLVKKTMTVEYPPNVVPDQVAGIITLPAETASVFPSAIIAPSLHSVTAKDPAKSEITLAGGGLYTYRDVDYTLYELFSGALTEAGFSLVSSELNSDDGAYHIVVSDGTISITVIYNMETKDMEVEYPQNTVPKTAGKYEAYTEVKDGDTFQILDGIKATVVGWQRVEDWTRHYYDSRYLITSRSDSYHSDEEYQYVILLFSIDNGSFADVYTTEMLDNFSVAWINDNVSDTPYATAGASNVSANTINTRSASQSGTVIKYGESGYFGVVFKLTAEQNVSGKTLAVTFTIPNYATRYVYFIDLANEKIAEE